MGVATMVRGALSRQDVRAIVSGKQHRTRLHAASMEAAEISEIAFYNQVVCENSLLTLAAFPV